MMPKAQQKETPLLTEAWKEKPTPLQIPTRWNPAVLMLTVEMVKIRIIILQIL